MGRRGRRKGKKKGGGGEDSNGNIPKDTNLAAQMTVERKNCAVFKCSSDNCGRQWNSTNSAIWEPDEVVECEFCFSKAEVVNVVDEVLDLDIYSCGDCGSPWKSIHDPAIEEGGVIVEEECDGCGEIVSSNGAEKQFGRHYWFACTNPKCPEQAEWEDFSLEPPEWTVECRKCESRGDIVKIFKSLQASAEIPLKPRRQQKLRKLWRRVKVDHPECEGGENSDSEGDYFREEPEEEDYGVACFECQCDMEEGHYSYGYGCTHYWSY